MSLSIYFDDDFVKGTRAADLRTAGFSVVIPRAVGTMGFSDPDHLAAATELDRLLVSHNIADFHRLHTSFANAGLVHSGIVLLDQVPYLSSAEIVRRFIAMAEVFGDVALTNQLLFLSNFGND